MKAPVCPIQPNSSVISSNWIKKLPAIWIKFQIKTQFSARNHTDGNPQQDVTFTTWIEGSMFLCCVMEITQWSTSHYIQYNMGKNWTKCKMLNDWFSWSINFVFIVILIWEVTYTFKGFSWCQLWIAKRKYVILPLSYKDIKLLCIKKLF